MADENRSPQPAGGREPNGDWFTTTWPKVWQVIVSIVGLLLLLWYLVLKQGENEFLIGIFIAMMNLPLIAPRTANLRGLQISIGPPKNGQGKPEPPAVEEGSPE